MIRTATIEPRLQGDEKLVVVVGATSRLGLESAARPVEFTKSISSSVACSNQRSLAFSLDVSQP